MKRILGLAAAAMILFGATVFAANVNLSAEKTTNQPAVQKQTGKTKKHHRHRRHHRKSGKTMKSATTTKPAATPNQ